MGHALSRACWLSSRSVLWSTTVNVRLVCSCQLSATARRGLARAVRGAKKLLLLTLTSQDRNGLLVLFVCLSAQFLEWSGKELIINPVVVCLLDRLILSYIH